MKRCSKCGEEKERSEFHRQSSAPDGLQYWCRPCISPPVDYPERLCLHCRSRFKPSKANHVYCSQRCGTAVWNAAQRPSRPCVVCGEVSARRLYCSLACQQVAQRERQRAATRPQTCGGCGVPFKRRGRPNPLCPRCRELQRETLRAEREALAAAAAARLERRENDRRARKRSAGLVCWLGRRPVPRVFIVGPCEACGETFVGRAAWGDRFCSPVCRRRTERRLRWDRRRAAQGAERIYRRKVFERDDWLCRLCLKPVDRDAKVPADLAPTLDHVVPLALGGEHVYSNVQCAHFICNSRKSDNVVQLRWAA